MSAGKIPNWKSIFQDVAQRNGAVEVTLHGHCEGTPPTYRVRLLKFDDQMVVVERPEHMAEAHVRQDDRVNILVAQGALRIECDARVKQTGRYKLNSKQSLMALQLTVPTNGRSAQRRSYFRALVTTEKLNAVVHPLDADGNPSTFFDPIPCSLINIGGGGIGLVAPQYARDVVERMTDYHCTLPLEHDGQPIALVVHQVHLQHNADGTSYLGLTFDFAGWEPVPKRRVVETICNFTAEKQRDQLRREREKKTG